MTTGAVMAASQSLALSQVGTDTQGLQAVYSIESVATLKGAQVCLQ